MNKEPGETAPPVESSPPPPSRSSRRVWLIAAPIIIVAMTALVVVWLRWPKQAGKAVPAPRTVTFEEAEQPATTAEQRLTLTPEQLRSARLKIETVGEQ